MFQKRKIQPIQKKLLDWGKSHQILSVLFVIAGLLLLRGVYGSFRVGQTFSVTQIVSHAIGASVPKDEHGNTNILLLGVGGETHDGAYLTDSIIINSVNYEAEEINMISLPRDLYLSDPQADYQGRINAIVEHAIDQGATKEEAIEILIENIEEITQVEIHRYALIDFTGFEKLIDAVGGISVQVENDIYDPYYPSRTPNESFPYDPFYIKKGLQTLDGATALKYARSRKTSSDFDRSMRQQAILHAFKEQATELGVLLSPKKLSAVYDTIQSHFLSNFEVSEIVSLAKLSQDYGRENIKMHTIHDIPYQAGGFLYTPEREAYNGAFVLVPYAKDFSEIQHYIDLLFHHPELYQNFSFQVLNGTSYEGLAGLVKSTLVRYGLEVSAHGNANSKGILETKLYTPLADPTLPEDKTREKNYRRWSAEVLQFLEFSAIEEAPAPYQSPTWPQKADIILELGEDFATRAREEKDFFYYGYY